MRWTGTCSPGVLPDPRGGWRTDRACVGSLAARLCRQPVRRARIVVLTLLGGFAVPWLGALPIAPRWTAGIVLPAPRLPTLSAADSRRG